MKRMRRMLVAVSVAALLSIGLGGPSLAGHGGKHVLLACQASVGYDTAVGTGTLPPAQDFQDHAALVRPCGI